jgi:hypothetical protein
LLVVAVLANEPVNFLDGVANSDHDVGVRGTFFDHDFPGELASLEL